MCDGICEVSEGLPDEVLPAAGSQSVQQFETQIRGDLCDGISDLLVGQQHDPVFQRDSGDKDDQEHAQGRCNAQKSKTIRNHLFQKGNIANIFRENIRS